MSEKHKSLRIRLLNAGGNMARTVVAIYDAFQTANAAVRDLVDIGFPRDNISIIANNSQGEINTPGASNPSGSSAAEETGAGAGVGAGIGAAIGGIGGLLIGLGALTIPGLGPVLAAGPLAVALSTLTGAGVGAVAGGVTGGLLGALIGLGIPEDEAQYYAEGVRRGGVLVTVQTDDFNTDQILDILNQHNPADINQRAAQWREEGWKGFHEDRPAPTQTPVESTGVQIFAIPETGATGAAPSTHTADTMPLQRDESEWTSAQATAMQRETGHVNPDYREHYNSYLADTGYPYDHYAPAYEFGYGIAAQARYQNSTWAVVEPEIRRDWERDHPGTWDRFQAAIQHAWERTAPPVRSEKDHRDL
jgi:hypothetical protein